MATQYFKKANFWARELRLPLFWMTDAQHEIFKNGVLVFYKNNVIHVYHIDDLEIRGAQKGYKFFSKNSNVIKYKKQIGKVRIMIKELVDSYTNIRIDNLTNSELKKKIFDLMNLLDFYSNTYTKTEAFVLSKIEENEKKYKNLIKELGNLRLILRKEGEPLFYNLFGVLLKETAKRFSLKLKDIFFYKYSELQKLLDGQKVRPKVIERRRKGYTLICIKGKKTILTGVQFKKLYKEIVLVKKTNQLTGQIAMKGKARGRARVILHNKRILTKDIAKFRKGEILVTEMIRPDTILACKKAAAIVTDEGGITSHAAIISRELKIPCIIATKIATQIIKSGAFLEVDAIGDSGVVKIIKRL